MSSNALLYLVLVDGHPAMFCGSREEADTVADMMRVRERKRIFGDKHPPMWWTPSVQYSTMGVTDNLFGDPEADTLKRAVGTRLAHLEGVFTELRSFLTQQRAKMSPEHYSKLWSLLSKAAMNEVKK